ncbi:ROK family transcriptional regulator [Paenibacillus xerothermodurans]|uniref:ROK family transcriptional regulator n=1 Tax=Paenibacillus xerothermodurans TaxID=1977292 RepID=A0A2W1P3N2_PAEXE|nr:ROK family transcriptional regulator [Paenibacillus xerothermodurans]PZE22322.1 ROK family transcriptional regulator [Paenibacillus xerothermodurans]
MNQMDIKDQKGSKLSILQTLRVHGSMSRIELTRLTGLSRATISISIAELIDLNLVHETDTRQSTKGRPATTLELVPRSRAIIGADLDNKTWTLGAFDLLGNVIDSMKINVNSFDPEAAFSTLADAVTKFRKGVEVPTVPLLGLGVPGLVDADHSVIRSAAELEWNNVEVASFMKKEIGWPTVVVNRHRARGLTECRYGAGRQFDHMIYIGVGTGIAAGLYINRQLLSGSLGGAGEIGHTTIEPDGPLCPCGNHGCLHMLAAGPAMEQEFRRLLRTTERSELYSGMSVDLHTIKAQDVCTAAAKGDELAQQVVKQAASYLGISMANLLNTFNPEAIILGGTIPNGSQLFVDTATKVMRQRAMSALLSGTEVKSAVYKEIGGALGAANFAFDKHISISFFS